jgi:hypothetical protein
MEGGAGVESIPYAIIARVSGPLWQRIRKPRPARIDLPVASFREAIVTEGDRGKTVGKTSKG